MARETLKEKRFVIKDESGFREIYEGHVKLQKRELTNTDYVVSAIIRIDKLCDWDFEYEYGTLKEAKKAYKTIKALVIKVPKELLEAADDEKEFEEDLKDFFKIKN